MFKIYPKMSEDLKEKAELLGEHVAVNVVFEMKDKYPEPMRWASGGFKKTLHANVSREAKKVILELLSEMSR